MNTKPLIVSALAASLALSGCTTTGLTALAAPFQAKAAASSDTTAPTTDKRRVAKSAGIGCLAGGALAFLTGKSKKDKKDKALVGCAAGAVVGGFASYYKQQLDDANAAAGAAKAAGLQATVETQQVEAKDGKAPALAALTIAYDAADMTALDADTRVLLDKLAALGERATNGPLTFRFTGTNPACATAERELRQRGGLDRHVVENRCGSGEHAIVVSPVPDVR